MRKVKKNSPSNIFHTIDTKNTKSLLGDFLSKNPLKHIWKFICRWADVVVFLPITIILFITADIWIHFIDPTAPVMSAEFLTILLFNILTWLLVMVGTYVVTRIMFSFDIFEQGWQERFFSDKPYLGVGFSILIWAIVLLVTVLLLTKNL